MRVPRLARDDRGVTIPLFALMAFAIVTLTLSGIDFIRFHMVRARVQSAVDAAALAIGRRLDSDTLQTDAEMFFWANVSADYMSADIRAPIVKVQGTPLSGQTITMDVSVDFPLLATAPLNVKVWSFDLHTRAVRETTNVELVLAMDNTGSMNDDGKLAAMKLAATTLIDTLIGDPEKTSRAGVSFGVVPFTTIVRTPGHASWLTTPDAGTVKLQTDAWGNLVTVRDTYNWWISYPLPGEVYDEARDWSGCVMENTTNQTTDLDVSPVGGTLPTYLIEDMTVCTDVRHNQCRRTAVVPVYDDAYCTIQPVSFLDGDSTVAKSTIRAMTAEGGTAVFTGLLWGWRMLSPVWDASHDWGDPKLPGDKDPSLTKAVVLLTDGANSDNLAQNDTDRGGYPSALGRGTSQATLDTALTKVCEDAKDDGVIIYTITFGNEVNTGNIRSLMRNCATNEAHFFDAPSTVSLQEAFTSIGGSLSRLSLIE